MAAFEQESKITDEIRQELEAGKTHNNHSNIYFRRKNKKLKMLGWDARSSKRSRNSSVEKKTCRSPTFIYESPICSLVYCISNIYLYILYKYHFFARIFAYFCCGWTSISNIYIKKNISEQNCLSWDPFLSFIQSMTENAMVCHICPMLWYISCNTTYLTYQKTNASKW